ncbi:unnamed protein product [Moneuplotes crassus]|uniref:Uncharacterized protein n=1 Tax=Euplotes crassus TaxID=5936 RepID=A0AAD1XTJ9_EUPCR|nr:unnamed protein product [Moneuplotes crassus]
MLKITFLTLIKGFEPVRRLVRKREVGFKGLWVGAWKERARDLRLWVVDLGWEAGASV